MQYGKFVIKENSAYGVAQPTAVSHEHKDIVMKENVAYTTTTTTTTTTRIPQYENLVRVSAKYSSYSKHNYDNVFNYKTVMVLYMSMYISPDIKKQLLHTHVTVK